MDTLDRKQLFYGRAYSGQVGQKQTRSVIVMYKENKEKERVCYAGVEWSRVGNVDGVYREKCCVGRFAGSLLWTYRTYVSYVVIIGPAIHV